MGRSKSRLRTSPPLKHNWCGQTSRLRRLDEFANIVDTCSDLKGSLQTWYESSTVAAAIGRTVSEESLKSLHLGFGRQSWILHAKNLLQNIRHEKRPITDTYTLLTPAPLIRNTPNITFSGKTAILARDGPELPLPPRPSASGGLGAGGLKKEFSMADSRCNNAP